MDTDQLKAFIAVADSGSFSVAADTLFITQPAISKRVSALEQRLGASLFDRLGRTVSLTEAGRLLLPRATGILAQTNQAELAVRELSGTVAGELNLVTSHHMGLHYLPASLRRFTQAYPLVRLNVSFQDSEKAIAMVTSGEVELAATTLTSEPEPMISEAISWMDPLEFVVARDHPLAQDSSPGLAALAKQPAILPEFNTITTKLVSQLFADAGLRLETRMTTNYLETIFELVANGLGWSVLPHSLSNDSRLHLIKLSGNKLQRKLGVVCHQKRQLSNAAKAFLDIVKASPVIVRV